MDGEGATGIEEIIRRNIAALRSKASLTQLGLAEAMLAHGIAWSRETVAAVEATDRPLDLTEAIAVAACLEVPLARLVATGASTVAVGGCEWTAHYLGAAIAGTAADVFPPDAYATRRRVHEVPREWPGAERPVPPGGGAVPPGSLPERRRRPRERYLMDTQEEVPGRGYRPPGGPSEGPGQPPSERLERRLRLRVTSGDVVGTGPPGWSRDLDVERARRAVERPPVGGAPRPPSGDRPAVEREVAGSWEQGAEPDGDEEYGDQGVALSPDEAAWEATRLNIILANKGYGDSDVTRWWNFTPHRELGGRTVAEAWQEGAYDAVSRLIQSLPETEARGRDRRLEG